MARTIKSRRNISDSGRRRRELERNSLDAQSAELHLTKFTYTTQASCIVGTHETWGPRTLNFRTMYGSVLLSQGLPTGSFCSHLFIHSCLLVLWTGTMTATVLVLCVPTKVLIDSYSNIYMTVLHRQCACGLAVIQTQRETYDALTIRQACT